MRGYLKGFFYFSTNWINFILILVVAFFITLGTLLYWVIGERTVASLSEQTLHRQQVIVRAGAKSIESFIELVSNSISLLSQRPDIYTLNEKAGGILESYISEWTNTPVVGVALVDKNGAVQFSQGKTGSGEKGIDVSDRDYYQWAKNAKEGEIHIGEPILSRLGAPKSKFVFTVATPLFREGEFNGVLAAGILINELTKTYIDPLKLSSDTRIYLIDDDGVFLRSPIESLVGENYIELLKETPFEGSEQVIYELTKAVSTRKESKLGITLPDERTGELTRFLISSSPVKLDGQFWTLAIASPLDEALKFYWPFQVSEIAVLLLFISMTIVFSALLIYSVRETKRRSYIKGFKRGKNHVGKKK